MSTNTDNNNTNTNTDTNTNTNTNTDYELHHNTKENILNIPKLSKCDNCCCTVNNNEIYITEDNNSISVKINVCKTCYYRILLDKCHCIIL